MTEYYLIRVLLAVALVFLCRLRLPNSLRNYAVFMAIYQALPQFLESATWWRSVWLPLSVVQLVMGWLVCVEIFDVQTRARTHWDERIMAQGFGVCLGLAFALTAWMWHPANALQAWTVVQQYYRIALFIGWLAVSLWFSWMRPLVPAETDSIARFWTIWLFCQAVMGMTGRAGLLWQLTPKSALTYRLVSDCGMMIQFLSVLYLAVKGKSHARRNEPGTDSPAY